MSRYLAYLDISQLVKIPSNKCPKLSIVHVCQYYLRLFVYEHSVYICLISIFQVQNSILNQLVSSLQDRPRVPSPPPPSDVPHQMIKKSKKKLKPLDVQGNKAFFDVYGSEVSQLASVAHATFLVRFIVQMIVFACETSRANLPRTSGCC